MNYDLFEKDLRKLINFHSLENRTDTPDYVLATYIVEYLKSLERLHRANAKSDHGG